MSSRMVLTVSSSPSARASSPRHPFPTFQLLVLATCRIAEPIALTSVLPYAYPMVKWLHVGDDQTAAFWAGVLMACFSLCEAFTGMYWGGLSDRIGRKPVLLLGCFGTLLSMLLLGLATNIWLALFARCLGGLLNGNIGVIQTVVGELVTDPAHEPRAFAIMPFCWSLGTIVGPMISGLLANSPLFPSRPYLLPNLVCAGLLLVSIMIGYFFLEETCPSAKNATPLPIEEDDETSLLLNGPALDSLGTDLRSEAYGTFAQVDFHHHDSDWEVEPKTEIIYESAPDSASADGKIFTRPVVLCVAALGIFCYHAMVFDSLLPVFLQDQRARDSSFFAAVAHKASPLFDLRGGLGMSTRDVGMIMSVNGLVALFIQGVIFPLVAEWLGVWRLFQLVTLLHPVSCLLFPWLALLPSTYLYGGIFACLCLRNILSILAYPLILILLKEACHPRYLGRINGLGASVGAIARCLAPPLSGVLYGVGRDVGFTGLAYCAGAGVAAVGAAELLWMRQIKSTTATIHGPSPTPVDHQGVQDSNDHGKDSAIHVEVVEV